MTRTGLIALLTAALLAAPARAEKALPPLLRGVGMQQRVNTQVPLDLEFRDETGQTVRLRDCCDGKPVVLVLAYYRCPMLCTRVLNGLVDGLRGIPYTIGQEFNVVTVSFDARETPAMAAAKKTNYVEDYGRPGAARGWHFLTGEQTSIDRLVQAVGFIYNYDPHNDQFVHASGIILLTPRGRVFRYFYGTRFEPRDLRLGLTEASENRIGTLTDRIILHFCYQYDLYEGRYTPVVMKFVRLTGYLTLAALAAFLFWAWRRERRRLPLAAEIGTPGPAAPGAVEGPP
jgi:protein SCO1/2